METVLKAQLRDDRGKGAARKLRARGLVPGVLYGHGVETQAIALSSQDLLHFFHATHGAAAVVDIEIDGKKHMALPREVQRDHLHGRFIHIDFLAVRRDEKVKMTVEIHETGEAPGIKTGGVIEHHLREAEIETLPGDVPEEILADVSALGVVVRGALGCIGREPINSEWSAAVRLGAHFRTHVGHRMRSEKCQQRPPSGFGRTICARLGVTPR